MSEAKVDNSATHGSLDQQMEALLSDVQSALDDVGAQLTHTPVIPETEMGLGESASTDANVALDEHLQEAIATEVAATTEAPSAVDVVQADVTTEPQVELVAAAESPVIEMETIEAVEPIQPAVAIETAAAVETEPEVSLETAVSNMVADATAALAVAEGDTQPSIQALDTAAVAAANPPEIMQASVEPQVTETPESQPSPELTAAPIATENAAEKVPTRTPATNVEDLDSQLASLTEQLLGEPTPEPGISMAPISVPAPVEAKPVSAPAATSKEDHAKPAATTRAAAVAKTVTIQTAAVAPLLLRVLGVLSAPLNKYPKVVRDTLGWVSLITLFWAGTIWAYLLFLHKPIEGEVPESAPHISGEAGKTGHEESGHGGSAHEEKQSPDSKHGSKAENGSEHASAKGNEHGAVSKKESNSADTHAESTKTADSHKASPEHGGH